MKFTDSLHENYEFRRVYTRGKSQVSPSLALYALGNRLGGNRLGITVSTKLGNAVVRNLVRRRLREIYRIHEGGFLSGFDLVAVARVRAASTRYSSLEHQFLQLAGRLGVLRRSSDGGAPRN